ncbi:alkaline phosphatase-like protein [Rickenella mellea]|uniref:GPI ethanolamine phosphate transferase 1 n=1 Tax=Rickenella mellea TaxID=50990 RepID=A0A4Y7QHI5_9AGAM|nr:alkaline phosphatase-like protein [Rickenella mellea]
MANMLCFLKSKLGSPTMKTLFLALIFHQIYLISVFDCYFKSSVVNGMQQFKVERAEAKRLVLFVGKRLNSLSWFAGLLTHNTILGDGLRADLIMNLSPFPTIPDSPQVVAPYLRSITQTRGAFGLSHTRIPTETRPGHVAMISGMYEDVSDVTKGWTTHPVEFDSVFNQSSHTFSFGPPDILPMFAKGAVPGKVKTWMYAEDDEDFTKDATVWDVWVLEQLETLLRNATMDRTLDKQLREDGVVFFLHFLGVDTTGHSYRPHSKEYMNSLGIIDNIIKKTEQLLKDFYGDEETSYIFTADHGMANIGNHGDGNPDSTRTPLIMWGKGIRGPLPDSNISSHDDYSRPWGLDQFVRQDVLQADIAPMMAILLGINFPVNSVGVPPDLDPLSPGYLYLKGGERALADAAVVNAKFCGKSILEQYRAKHREKAEHTVFYKPFSGPEETTNATSSPGAPQLAEIEHLFAQEKWTETREKSIELIRTLLDGLKYLQTYDLVMLRSVVVAGYTGWAAFSITSLIFSDPLSSSPSRVTIFILHIIAASVLLVFWTLFSIQESPRTYYLYVAFPCYFWHNAIRRTVTYLSGRGWNNLSLKSLGQCAAVILSLLCMVAAYTNRAIWSIGFVFIGIYWPLVHWPSSLRKGEPKLLVGWVASCLVTALTPLRDVEQKESAALVYIPYSEHERHYSWLLLQCCWRHLNDLRRIGLKTPKETVPYPWLCEFRPNSVYHTSAGKVPPSTPIFVSKIFEQALAAEGLFYLAYSTTLIIWISVETKVRMHTRKTKDLGKVEPYKPGLDDVGFFGAGNFSSVASFYLEPIYRLVPVFNPFLAVTLVKIKIVAPFVLLSAVLATLNSRLGLPPFSLLRIALSMTDVMTLTFFLNVSDKGSWQDIGQGISSFVVSSLLIVFSTGVCMLGEWLMSGSTSRRPSGDRKLL